METRRRDVGRVGPTEVRSVSMPVAAAVGYDPASRRAVLNPADKLRPGTTYVATLRGRSDGARDLAGNALPAAETWSFTVRR